MVALAGLTMAGLAAPASAFTIDGVVSAGDTYSVALSVGFLVEGTSTTEFGTLRIGREPTNSDGTGGDIFLLLEVPTALKDLSYGANAANGWGIGGHAYDKAQGSEKWVFNLLNGAGGTTGAGKVELKLKQIGAATAQVGHKLEKNGGGLVLSAATSLDNNLNLFADPANITLTGGGTLDLTQDSPAFGDIDPLTSDEDQYASVDSQFAGYEFAQIYELQIDGSGYGPFANLADFQNFIAADSIVHASPPKPGGKNKMFNFCLDSSNCQPTNGPPPTTNVPEPSAISMFGFGLFGLVILLWRGRRETEVL